MHLGVYNKTLLLLFWEPKGGASEQETALLAAQYPEEHRFSSKRCTVIRIGVATHESTRMGSISPNAPLAKPRERHKSPRAATNGTAREQFLNSSVEGGEEKKSEGEREIGDLSSRRASPQGSGKARGVETPLLRK